MQNRGTCCLKKCFNTERSRESFARKPKEIASLMKMHSTLKVPYCITKCALAIIYSNSFSHCKVDQKKTVAISQTFNHVQLHVHLMHLFNTRICRYTCIYITPSVQIRHSWSGNILSFLLPLFQEGQLSVTGESMCTKYLLTA